MNEWTLLLKMMAEPRQAREQYKTLPAPPVTEAPAPASHLTKRDRAMIRAAVRRAMECATGKLIVPEGGALAVPEFRAGCVEGKR